MPLRQREEIQEVPRRGEIASCDFERPQGSAPPGPGYGGGGAWEFVQTLNSESTNLNSIPYAAPAAFTSSLDTGYPAPGGTNSSDAVFTDAPEFPLSATNASYDNGQLTALGELATTQSYTTYVMWDPAIATTESGTCTPGTTRYEGGYPVYFPPQDCASVPVPIDSVNWGWSGDAIQTLNPSQKTAQKALAGSWYFEVVPVVRTVFAFS